MAEQRPHSLIGWLDPGLPWQVSWVAEPCPYEADDPDKPCKWGEVADRCEWDAFENYLHYPGAHTDDLPGYELCESESRGEYMACWEGREPEECDGFEHSEAGHLHPTGECGLAASMEIGYEDGWTWSRRAKRHPILGAVFVTMEWTPDLELTPVMPALEEIE